jgi:hypothetical protein
MPHHRNTFSGVKFLPWYEKNEWSILLRLAFGPRPTFDLAGSDLFPGVPPTSGRPGRNEAASVAVGHFDDLVVVENHRGES